MGGKDGDFVDQVSFKMGFYGAVQIFILLGQFKYLKKKLLGKLPFVIQILWTITNVTYYIYQSNLEKFFYFVHISNAFDFITKALVIYFICVRVMFLSDISSPGIKVAAYGLFFSGTIMSFFGLFYYNFFSNSSKEMYDQAILISNWIYIFLDLYISIIELVSLTIYLYIKYDLKTIMDVWPTIRRVKLRLITFLIICTALTSVVYVCLFAFGLDSDWNWNTIVSTVKYSWCCDFVFIVFEKTLKKPSTVLDSPNFSKTESKRPPHFQETTTN